MRIGLIIVLMLLVTGCASVAPSRALQQYESVTLAPWVGDAKAVTGVSFTRSAQGRDSASLIGICVSQNVTNRSVTVTGQESTYIGPYTGRVYSNVKSDSVSGGEVVLFASEDGNSVVAQGSESYQVPMLVPVEKSVRYTLTATEIQNGFKYAFTNIESAQLNTGVVANQGYSKLGAHEGASPELALAALESLASDIDSCMYQ
ncbi:hypothetical protein [Halopseudomonas laoshanensis]|uniref:hypothetical protein n=1 Tax=Halopseudomonas laoshanensis TaxID=2268758 RepID=UPI0037363FD7